MSVTGWGEAAWTARDLLYRDLVYVVTDNSGTVRGRYATEHEAIARRWYLSAQGVECWIRDERTC